MFKKTTLKNGTRLILTPLKDTKAITLLVLVATGSKYESKEVNGISHLLEHMVFKGTKNRPQTSDLAKELDRIGGFFNAFTGKEYMGFWVKVDSKHLNIALDIVSDMLFNSLFKEGEIEKEKKVIFEEINMIKDSPQGHVLNLWEGLLYGDQPSGWLISGEKETVAKISRNNILNYLKNQFVAKNIVISLAGNFGEAKMKKEIEKFFGAFKKEQPLGKKPTKEAQSKPQSLIGFKETDQSHLCLGVRTFDLFSPQRHALAVLSGVLGGGMSSRLFIKVREKQSLAYYIRTFPELYTDSGYLVTHAGVANNRIEEALKIILGEYKDLSTKKVTKEELSKVKEHIKSQINLELETSDSWASFCGGQEILRNEIQSPEQECREIDKITQDDILKLAKEIFRPENLNLALIGPFKEKDKFQNLLNL